MDLQKVLDCLFANAKLIFIFWVGYILFGISFYVIYSMCIRKKTFFKILKECPKVLKIMTKFNYPILDIYSLKQIKGLIAKAVIPIMHLNTFWTDITHIQLKNAQYQSKKGTIELTELNLKEQEIEIFYKVKSNDKKLNLVKGKSNFLSINDIEYKCEIETAQRKIVAKCSGYYVFNDTNLIFKGKFRYGDSFEIAIDTSSFFDYNIEFGYRELVDVCSFVSQMCIVLCVGTVSIISLMRIGLKFIFAIGIISFLIIRLLLGIVRRFFDVLREAKFI